MPAAKQAVLVREVSLAPENPLSREELESCLSLGKDLTSALEPNQVLGRIMQRLSALLPAENWSLLLLDEGGGHLCFQLSVNLDQKMLQGIKVPLKGSIAGQAVLQGKPVVVEDVSKCEHFLDQVDRITGFTTRSVISVPLLFGGRPLGVLEVVNPRRVGAHTLPLLQAAAEYAAIAVENMNRFRRIQYLAEHDDLTKLYNTRYMYRALEQLLAQSRQESKPLGLIFMDLDNFKSVVDTYGHLMGSLAISEVAATIKAVLSEPAFAVAYGGDEFVAVLPGADAAQTRAKAEEIRERMKGTVYLVDHGHQVELRASFGVASYPDDAENLKKLLARADRDMFQAKGQGKDRVYCPASSGQETKDHPTPAEEP